MARPGLTGLGGSAVVPDHALPLLSDAFVRLSQLSAGIDSTLDLRKLLKRVARMTADICRVDRCSIFLRRGTRLVPAMASFAGNLAGLDEVPALARAITAIGPSVRTFNDRSLLVVPLLRGDRAVGVLVLDHCAPINEDQVGLAQVIGGRVAAAIETIRLVSRLRRRLRKTETLLTVGHIVSSTLDLREVARRITREAARAVGADSAGIYVERDLVLQPLAGYHIPKTLLEALRHKPVVRTSAKEPRETIWSDDVPNDPAFRHEIFRLFPVQSLVVTPLRARDESLGMLVCAWWRRRRRLTPGDLRLVEGIAGHAAVAIVNARLYEQADAVAVLRERNRMDALLHDTLSPTLFSLAVKLELCRQTLQVGSALQSKLEAVKRDAA